MNWSLMSLSASIKQCMTPLFKKTIAVSSIYLLLWSVYFFVFNGIDLLAESTQAHWFRLLYDFKAWFISTGYYKSAALLIILAIPLLCAAVFGVITAREKLLRVWIYSIILAFIFCSIPSIFDILFYRHIFSFLKAFPFLFILCTIGLFSGRFFRKYVFK